MMFLLVSSVFGVLLFGFLLFHFWFKSIGSRIWEFGQTGWVPRTLGLGTGKGYNLSSRMSDRDRTRVALGLFSVYVHKLFETGKAERNKRKGHFEMTSNLR